MAAQTASQPSPQPPQSPGTVQGPLLPQDTPTATNPPEGHASTDQTQVHKKHRRKTETHTADGTAPAAIADRPRPGSTNNQGEQPGHSTPKHYVEYDLSKGSYSGETLRGPVTVWATHLNTIRWDYEFNSVSTYKAGPDLSASLTTAPVPTQSANTVAPAKSPATAAPPPPPPPPPAPKGAHARPAPHAANPPKPPQALLDFLKQADHLTQNAEDLNEKLKGDADGVFTDQVNQLASLNTRLIQLQNHANAAVALVTQAGAALQSYLKSTGNNILDLESQTRDQLNGASPFAQGVGTTWPSPQDVLDLQNTLAANSADLNNASKKIATYLSDLQGTEKKLSGLKDSLVSENTKYQNATADAATDAQVKQRVASIDSAVQQMQTDETYANQTSGILTAAIAQNQSAITNAALLSPSSPNYQSFVTAQTTLRAWYERMSTKLEAYDKWKRDAIHNPDPFAIYRDATCAFAFSGTKDTAITLTRVDLTPTQSTPAPETPLTVTVECTTPFSVSAGVVFSTIPDNQYEVASKTTTAADGSSTTTNYIRQTSGSSFHPLPLALANVRLYEWSEHVAVYSSFGVAANIRGQNAGGSTAEYLIGPSIGFFRGIFLTAGAHIGNEVTVGGGYKVGGPLPSGQNTVPLSSNYHAGFGLGITFTKP